MSIKEKISALLEELNPGLHEKEPVVRLVLLSAVAGESIFLLGPPGTAKSLVARRLKYAFAGRDGKEAAVFEYLMSRFSTPDEIFGPVAISKLKADKYERVVEGYLPAAEAVFLDEIWKAGPSIQNALLTIVNEKVFRNGETEINVPMKALIAASNELPAKGEGLEALWDRFLVRLVVEGIESRETFNKMISGSENLYKNTVSDENKITEAEYLEWNQWINEVRVPENVFNVIHVIRNDIAGHNKKKGNEENQMYVSDRRWRKIVRLLRTSAFLNGREEVDLMDCFLIRHCIWDDVTQIDTAHQFVSGAIEEHGYTRELNLSDIKKELEAVDEDVKKWTKGEKPVEHDVPKVYGEDDEKCYRLLLDNDNMILEDDIKGLTSKYSQSKRFRSGYSSYDSSSYSTGIYIKASSTNNHVFIADDEKGKNEQEVALETEVKTWNEEFPYIKPAHHGAQKEWNKRLQVVLTQTGNLKTQLDSYRKNDLKHIRINLFVVDEECAKTVEKNLDDLEQKIGTLEVEARRIQGAYENIKPSESHETKMIGHEK
ncbi:MAG: ATPase ravA [Treponematales bacterium]